MQKLSRKTYSDLFGITVGDSVRLANTNLWIKVEKDLSLYGEEAVFGGGKTLRDGMGQNPVFTRENPKVMDLVITNALILDYTGIYKADIGVKDGKIAAIGHAGNPFLSDNIETLCSKRIVLSSSTLRIVLQSSLYSFNLEWVSDNDKNILLKSFL